MSIIMMRPTDLAELHTLLTMYRDTYGGVPDDFIEQVTIQYHKAASSRHCDTVTVPKITNPRSSGRTSKIPSDVRQEILNMRRSGNTMREISAITGYALGLVHKLIHEHINKED